MPARRRGGRRAAASAPGAGAAGVDAHHVELALDGAAGAAVAAADAPARRRAGRRREAEPDGQLEVVARRAHGGGHQVAVEVDLERLLDDEAGRAGAAARAPSQCWVSTVAVRPRVTARGYRPRQSVASGGGRRRRRPASSAAGGPAAHAYTEHADHRHERAHRKLVWRGDEQQHERRRHQQEERALRAVAARRSTPRAGQRCCKRRLLRLHRGAGRTSRRHTRLLVGALLLAAWSASARELLRASAARHRPGVAAPASSRRQLAEQLGREREAPVPGPGRGSARVVTSGGTSPWRPSATRLATDGHVRQCLRQLPRRTCDPRPDGAH